MILINKEKKTLYNRCDSISYIIEKEIIPYFLSIMLMNSN